MSQTRSLDFDIVKEPWNKYELGDHTILKTRVILKVVRKVSKGDKNDYEFDLQNLQALIVPNDVKGAAPAQRYSKEEIQSSEWKETRYRYYC